MNMTEFNTVIIDCDGILINHYQGILSNIYQLQQNLPQDSEYRKSLIRHYLTHYYGMSASLNENGFCISHCFSFKSLMTKTGREVNWRALFRFGRTVSQWPAYEDAYGALHYLKKFYRVYVRCDREPEDTEAVAAALGISEEELIIRGSQPSELASELAMRNIDTEKCLLITTPHLAGITDFKNIRVITRSKAFISDMTETESLAGLVMEHQSRLRNSWH